MHDVPTLRCCATGHHPHAIHPDPQGQQGSKASFDLTQFLNPTVVADSEMGNHIVEDPAVGRALREGSHHLLRQPKKPPVRLRSQIQHSVVEPSESAKSYVNGRDISTGSRHARQRLLIQ